MHNSEKPQGHALAYRLALCGTFLFTACSAAQVTDPATATARSAVKCTIETGALSEANASAVAELQRGAEASPFFTIPASAPGPVSCSVRNLPDGQFVLEYKFARGGWLQIKHDARIEYSEQNARFDLRPGDDPNDVLAKAERAAFGRDGCGIDWRQPEIKRSEVEPGVTETIFRGDACNCQARVRRRGDGRVLGFALKSAC